MVVTIILGYLNDRISRSCKISGLALGVYRAALQIINQSRFELAWEDDKIPLQACWKFLRTRGELTGESRAEYGSWISTLFLSGRVTVATWDDCVNFCSLWVPRKTHRLKGWRKLSLLYQGEDQRCQVSAFRTELGSLIQNLSISDDGTWESTETTWGQGFRAINQSIVNIIKYFWKHNICRRRF